MWFSPLLGCVFRRFALAGDPFEGFLELEGKEDRGEGDGDEIGHRLRHIDGRRLVGGEEQRHDVDQRDQQDEFPHDRDKDGGLCVAQR